MGYFQSLVDQYEGRYPNHFQVVAARLREGDSALEVRNQLREEMDLSRLQAGKVGEDVEKAVRDFQIALGTGTGFVLMALVFTSPLSLGFWALMLFGSAQAVAGMRGMQAYRAAEDNASADDHSASADDQ